MSGHDMFRLFEDIFEGTRTFENGFPINLTGWWAPEIKLVGTTAGTAANYNTFAINPYTSVDVRAVYCVYSGASTGAATVNVERIQGTEANDAGDNLLTTPFDLNTTVNLVQTGSLVANGNTTLSSGNRLGLVDGGAVAGTDDLVIQVLCKILQF